LTENLQSAVALIDERGAFTIVNSSFLRFFDLPPKPDIRNVNSLDWAKWQVFDECGVPLDVDEHPVRKAALARTAVKNQLVAMKSPSNPELKWLLVSAEPILDAQGKLHRLICTFCDITDRKAAEKALRDSEERLRIVIENSRDGINMLDLGTGRYVLMSPAQLELTGFTAEEINNTSDEDALERLHPDDREISLAQQKLLASGQDLSALAEYRWRVKSGEYRWFSDSRKLVRDAQGHPVALVGTSRDITNQKQAEEALRGASEQRRLAMEAAALGSWDYHFQTGEVFWDERCQELFGVPSGNQVPYDGAIACIHPDDRAAVDGKKGPRASRLHGSVVGQPKVADDQTG